MVRWTVIIVLLLNFFQLRAQEVVLDRNGNAGLKTSAGDTLKPQVLSNNYLLFQMKRDNNCGLYLVNKIDPLKPSVCLSKTEFEEVFVIPDDLIFLKKNSLWGMYQFNTESLQLEQVFQHEYTFFSKRGRMMILEKNGKSRFYTFDSETKKLTQVYPHEFDRLTFSNYGRYVFVKNEKKHGLYKYNTGLKSFEKTMAVKYDTIYDTRNKMFIGVKYKKNGSGYGQKYKYYEKSQSIVRRGRIKITVEQAAISRQIESSSK